MTTERSMPDPNVTPGVTPTTPSPAGTADIPATYPVPAVGTAVYAADGDKLGTVKEVRANAFKVDAPMRPDYWLSTSSIRTASADRVELAFPKDRLGDYKQDNPVQA